jgi:hypothetical protein
LAKLAVVGGVAKFERLPDVLDILGLQVGGNLLQECFGI